MTDTSVERTRVRCRLDLDLLVFDGDRDRRTALLVEETLSRVSGALD